jgi:hypothetical protein
MTPAEMVKMFQERYPDIEVRLSRPGDPELSSVFINFYPKSMRSKTNTPPGKSASNLPEREPEPGK